MWVVRVRGTGNEASGKTAGSARVRVRLFYRALQASSHREGTQMAADFSQLTERVNEAQSEIKATLTKDRDQLQSQVQQAQSKAEQQADEIKAKGAQKKAEAATGWEAMQDRWRSHIAQLHQRAADLKAERDLHKAQKKAEHAEAKAEDAIGFAIAAAQEAEYAVLHAALARLDADALAGSS